MKVVLRAAILVAFAGVAGVGAFVLSDRQPAVFEAESTLRLVPLLPDESGVVPAAVTAHVDPGAYRQAAGSAEVLGEALRSLGAVASPQEVRALRLQTRVSVVTDGEGRRELRVYGRAEGPERAVERADAVASAMVAWDARRARETLLAAVAELEREADRLGEQIRALQTVGDEGSQAQIDRLVELRTARLELRDALAAGALPDGGPPTLEPLATTTVEIAPRPYLNSLVAATAAVAIAYLLLLLPGGRPRRRRIAGAATVGGLSVLAAFPSWGRREPARVREAANLLMTSLLHLTQDVDPRVIMVTSIGPGEGKTTVVHQLAEALASYGYRTLLVDADLHTPMVAVIDAEGADPSQEHVAATIHEWLRDPLGDHRVEVVTVAGDSELDLVPRSGPSPVEPEALGRSFAQAIKRWSVYDVVLVDVAPVAVASDATVMARHCSGAVVVVDQQRSDGRRVAAARRALRRRGATVLGAVWTNIAASAPAAGPGADEAATAVRSARRRGTSVVAPAVRSNR